MVTPVGIDLYPGEQPAILREARVPVLKTWRPMWPYITAVCVRDDGPTDSLLPTEIEQRQVASFHQQYVTYWYGTAPGQFTGWYNKQRAENEFDIDGGANGRLLLQRPNGGWAYMFRSWEHGPRPMIDEPPMTLLEVLDRAHYSSDKWERWKAIEPELFGPEAYAAARAALDEQQEAARGQA